MTMYNEIRFKLNFYLEVDAHFLYFILITDVNNFSQLQVSVKTKATEKQKKKKCIAL